MLMETIDATGVPEGAYAAGLGAIADAHPSLSIGSYPSLGEGRFRNEQEDAKENPIDHQPEQRRRRDEGDNVGYPGRENAVDPCRRRADRQSEGARERDQDCENR